MIFILCHKLIPKVRTVANYMKKSLIIDLIAKWEDGQSRGLGKGERNSYLPWINIRTFHSETSRYRVPSSKLNRTVHLMSSGELNVFQYLEWQDNVYDIREQYPLDPHLTCEIASNMGILHPGYCNGGMVMTSDFLVSMRTKNGNLEDFAIQVKYSDKDIDRRTLEKIRIEKGYWDAKGVTFQLIYSSTMSSVLIRNLNCLYRMRQEIYPEEDLLKLFNVFCKLREALYDVMVSALPDTHYIEVPSGARYTIREGIQILCAKKFLKFPVNLKLLNDCRLGEVEESQVDI